jgi:heme/copper-type cytochrome/quinol oxidase subunit 2
MLLDKEIFKLIFCIVYCAFMFKDSLRKTLSTPTIEKAVLRCSVLLFLVYLFGWIFGVLIHQMVKRRNSLEEETLFQQHFEKNWESDGFLLLLTLFIVFLTPSSLATKKLAVEITVGLQIATQSIRRHYLRLDQQTFQTQFLYPYPSRSAAEDFCRMSWCKTLFFKK